MTLPEIHLEAEKKYGIVRNRHRDGVLIKGDCETTRRFKRRAKAAFIEKMLVLHGHKKVT